MPDIENMPKVSVVVVSYNTMKITDRCLTCIERSNYPNVELIVVDNLSTDGSVEMIKKKHPKAKLLLPKTNTGYTGGNNLGMQQATGDYLLLLNSDAFLESDTITRSVGFMAMHPECAVLGCKLTFADGRFQPSTGFLPDPLNTLLWVWGVDTLPVFKQLIPSVHIKKQSSRAQRVGWVMGAFMFTTKEAFTKTGGFDEHFFMYLEEVEWCKRLSQKNLQIWYDPSFSVVHLFGASSNYDVSKPLIREMQGLVYYFKKHYPLLAPLMKLLIWGGNIARIIAFTIVGKPAKAAIYKQIVGSL